MGTIRTTRNTPHTAVATTMSVSDNILTRSDQDLKGLKVLVVAPISFSASFILTFIKTIIIDENGFKVKDDSLCDEICLAR